MDAHVPLSEQEIKFVLAALRFFCAADSRRAKEASVLFQNDQLDWKRLVSVAGRHRVSAFLACALQKAQLFSCLPTPVQGLLKSAVDHAAVENLAKRREFTKYSGLLAERDIPVIPLKGMALTHTVYKDAPVRRMGDIDLFVRESDLGEIRQLLEAQGFEEKAFANLWHTEIVCRLIGRGSYVKEGLDLDLQWRPTFYIGGDYVEWDSEGAWASAIPCPELGSNVSFFSPKYQAQYLLLQAANDFNQDYLFFIQLLDLAMVMSSAHLVPEEMLPEVAGQRKSRAQEQLGALCRAVQEIFLTDGGPEDISGYSEQIIQRVFESRLDVKASWGGKAMLQAPIPWRDKVVFSLGYFFPEPAYIRQQYGSGIRAWAAGFGGHWARLLRKLMG